MRSLCRLRGRRRTSGPSGLPAAPSESGGVFTVRGAGADIWGTADSFHFMSQPLSGNGEIVARVMSIQNTNALAKAGVMIRGALTAGSAHVILDVKPGGGVEFMSRNANGGNTVFIAGATASVPVWLRLKRDGSTVIGSWSSDGATWKELGRTTITLPTTVYVGLPVTSHSTGTLNTVTFNNVSVDARGGQCSTDRGNEYACARRHVRRACEHRLEGNRVGFRRHYHQRAVPRERSSAGTDTTSPYEWTWTGVPSGSYSLVAVATDSRNDQTRSTPVSISVTAAANVAPPAAPSVSMPSAGATGVSVERRVELGGCTRRHKLRRGARHDRDAARGVAQPDDHLYQPPAPLSYDTTYYWRVTAKNSGGSTPGPLWSFTTESAPPAAAPPPSTTLRRLRLMTWNVNGGRSATNVADVSAQVSLIASSGAHVVVLQEVTIESGSDLPALYNPNSRPTGRAWHAVWAEEPEAQRRFRRAISCQHASAPPLPRRLRWTPSPFDAADSDARRSAARIGVVVNGVTVTIAGTTLASDGERRKAQIAQLQNWMAGISGRRWWQAVSTCGPAMPDTLRWRRSSPTCGRRSSRHLMPGSRWRRLGHPHSPRVSMGGGRNAPAAGRQPARCGS